MGLSAEMIKELHCRSPERGAPVSLTASEGVLNEQQFPAKFQ